MNMAVYDIKNELLNNIPVITKLLLTMCTTNDYFAEGYYY